MFFCKKCGFSNNYTKDVKNKKTNTSTNYEGIAKIFEKFMQGEEIVENDLKQIKGSQLLKDDKYDVMNKKDQRKFMSVIKNINKNFFVDHADEDNNDNTNIAYYICKYCNFQEPIDPGTIIYTKKYNTNMYDIDDYSYLVYSNTLARTKNYICKNKKCDTHNDINLREAVITKNESDRIIYVCCVCKISMFE